MAEQQIVNVYVLRLKEEKGPKTVKSKKHQLKRKNMHKGRVKDLKNPLQNGNSDFLTS